MISDCSRRHCLRLTHQIPELIFPTSRPTLLSTDISLPFFSWLSPAGWFILQSLDRRLEARILLMKRCCKGRGEFSTRPGPKLTRSGCPTSLEPPSHLKRLKFTSRLGRSSHSSAVSVVISLPSFVCSNACATDNIIREALKRRLDEFGLVTQDHSLETSSHGCLEMVQRLYSIAQFKCHYLVRTVGSLIRQHLGTSFFQYDASQVRDGVLFAGLLLANDGIGSAEDIDLCVSALREMRWAYSKSEEREQSIRMAWQVKSSGSQHKPTPYIPSSFSPSYPAPSVGHFRAAVHPEIEIPAFISVSSSSSSDEPHWPGPAISKLDASSPSSFHHGLPSPTTESTRQLCISVTPTLPATSEGHPTPAYHYAPEPEALRNSDRFTYPYPTCKGSPFESDTSPTMYYSQGLNNPTVTTFFPDSSSPPIPGASATYSTTQFHYIGN